MLREPDKDGKVPLKSYEWIGLKCIWAAQSVLECDNDKLEERLKAMVPNGWRDLRMITLRLRKILDQLVDTIPTNKLYSIKSEMLNTEMRILSRGPSNGVQNIVHLSTTEMKDLINLLINRECMLCDKTADQGKRCPIFKAITNCMHYELDESTSGSCQLCGIEKVDFQ